MPLQADEMGMTVGQVIAALRREANDMPTNILESWATITPPMKQSQKMNTATATTIRTKLNLKRLDGRRFFAVDDGAYTWIGDRADLNAADAAALRAINRVGTRPDLASAAEQAAADAADYDAICGRGACIAATHNSAGIVAWESLPESWRDGSALGEIAPIAPKSRRSTTRSG